MIVNYPNHPGQLSMLRILVVDFVAVAPGVGAEFLCYEASLSMDRSRQSG